MASGHVNRTNRPNTWLHRPSLRREDSPCQPGAVHTWHISDLARCPVLRRCWGQSGHQSIAVTGASDKSYHVCDLAAESSDTVRGVRGATNCFNGSRRP